MKSFRTPFLLVSLLCSVPAIAGAPTDAEQRFRDANELARHGDLPKAIDGYRTLAESGARSASLYWNWAQAARSRGLRGEALWAFLCVRELEPGDPVLRREIEGLRAALNLDSAEISPEPLAQINRFSRRFRLDLWAAVLFLLSIVLHGLRRILRRAGSSTAAWVIAAAGIAVAVVALSAARARPEGIVLRAKAPLLESASETAESIGALREGEVLPILGASGDYVRVQDSSGARGWAHIEDVRGLSSANGLCSHEE